MVAEKIEKLTWWEGLTNSLKSQTATWLVAFLIGILSIFSGHITESMRFALNRADLRTKQFEELAKDISQYIFSAEWATELIGKNLTSNKSLKELVDDYNSSVTTLRKKEFVYAAWIQRFWGKEQSIKFNLFMKSVHEFDNVIHSLNDEFEKVNNAKPEQKKVDAKRAKEAFIQLQPILNKLRERGRTLIVSLYQ